MAPPQYLLPLLLLFPQCSSLLLRREKESARACKQFFTTGTKFRLLPPFPCHWLFFSRDFTATAYGRSRQLLWPFYPGLSSSEKREAAKIYSKSVSKVMRLSSSFSRASSSSVVLFSAAAAAVDNCCFEIYFIALFSSWVHHVLLQVATSHTAIAHLWFRFW